MDSFPYIKHHQRFSHLFSIFNFTCCKFVAFKDNLSHFFHNRYNKQSKHTPQRVPYRGSGFLTFFLIPIILCLTLLLDVNSTKQLSLLSFVHFSFRSSLNGRPPIGQNVSILASRQILPKYLPAVLIFSVIGIKFLYTRQCLPALSPIIIPPVSSLQPTMHPSLILLCCHL